MCNLGSTLKQSSAVHIPASYSADGILLSISNNNEHFIINLASVPGRQLVNSPTAQSLVRYRQCYLDSMLTKINRQDALRIYTTFPLRNYDYKKDEEMFFYPKIYTSNILTILSKSFRGLSTQSGIGLTKLTKDLSYDTLLFMGDTELSWLNQNNDYRPAKEAQQYLINNKVGKRFNGALQVHNSELPTFIKHLSWLTRCNASLPYFHFIDSGQNVVGHICKYGNLHIDTLKEGTSTLLKKAISKSSFKYLDANNCYNQFGKSSAIPGRRIIV